MLKKEAKAGIDLGAFAAQLHDDGAKSYVKSCNELIVVIASENDTRGKAG